MVELRPLRRRRIETRVGYYISEFNTKATTHVVAFEFIRYTIDTYLKYLHDMHGIKTKKLGFTLIELLVVISIISLLSAIGAASLNSTRAKARDARRIADIKQIATAIELYYDKNNSVPGGPPATYKCRLNNNLPPSYYFPTGLQALVTEGFLSQIPCDPKGPELCDAGGSNCTGYGKNYYYLARSNGWWSPSIGYCGTEQSSNYEYTLVFSPEATTVPLPKFTVTTSAPSASSTCGGGTSDCCIAGLKL